MLDMSTSLDILLFFVYCKIVIRTVDATSESQTSTSFHSLMALVCSKVFSRRLGTEQAFNKF